MSEQRGVRGTMTSTRRAPAVQVIPGLFFLVIAGLDPAIHLASPLGCVFFMSSPGIDPGIQINNKANLLTWILGSSPRMTVPLCPSQSPAGATRGTGHNDINPPRACRAGHCRGVFFYCHCRASTRQSTLQSTTPFTNPCRSNAGLRAPHKSIAADVRPRPL